MLLHDYKKKKKKLALYLHKYWHCACAVSFYCQTIFYDAVSASATCSCRFHVTHYRTHFNHSQGHHCRRMLIGEAGEPHVTEQPCGRESFYSLFWRCIIVGCIRCVVERNCRRGTKHPALLQYVFVGILLCREVPAKPMNWKYSFVHQSHSTLKQKHLHRTMPCPCHLDFECTRWWKEHRTENHISKVTISVYFGVTFICSLLHLECVRHIYKKNTI